MVLVSGGGSKRIVFFWTLVLGLDPQWGRIGGGLGEDWGRIGGAGEEVEDGKGEGAGKRGRED